jgi:hypothetical protein
LHIEADHTRVAMGQHWVLASFGKGNSVGFFDDTMTDAMTQQARALLLALLRDHHPGEEAPPALVEAMGSYLRLNPDDDEMKEAWETFTVRPR